MDPFTSPDSSASTLDVATLREIEALGADSGNDALLDTLIRAFFASVDASSRSFREGLSTNDLRKATVAIHTLKGAAASMGAQRLATVCQHVETVLRQGRAGDAARWQPRIDREVDAALQAMQGFVAGRS